MPVVGSVDLATKRIYLATGVRSYHPVDDIYKELRALRHTDDTLRGFEPPVTASGNVAKGGGRFTPRLATFRNGWRVVPEDVSHTLTITGEQITDDGQAGPAVMDFGPLSATSKVIVNYQPPEAEIIDSGASGFTASDRALLEHVYRMHANRLRIDLQTSKLLLYDDSGAQVVWSCTLGAKGGGALDLPDGVQIDRVPDP